MSNRIPDSPEEEKKTIQIDLKGFDIPGVLWLGGFKKSPHILQPDKIALFSGIFDDVYRYCEGFLGEFVLQEQDYARYFAVMLEFARPHLQQIYDEHAPDLERMIMHVSANMIDDKKKFLAFFLLQMFLLQKWLQRNLPVTKRLLSAKTMMDVDLVEVHENLRKDAQSLLFVWCPYSCTFVTPHPNNIFLHSEPKNIERVQKWNTKKMMAKLSEN